MPLAAPFRPQSSSVASAADFGSGGAAPAVSAARADAVGQTTQTVAVFASAHGAAMPPIEIRMSGDATARSA